VDDVLAGLTETKPKGSVYGIITTSGLALGVGYQIRKRASDQEGVPPLVRVHQTTGKESSRVVNSRDRAIQGEKEAGNR